MQAHAETGTYTCTCSSLIGHEEVGWPLRPVYVHVKNVGVVRFLFVLWKICNNYAQNIVETKLSFTKENSHDLPSLCCAGWLAGERFRGRHTAQAGLWQFFQWEMI